MAPSVQNKMSLSSGHFLTRVKSTTPGPAYRSKASAVEGRSRWSFFSLGKARFASRLHMHIRQTPVWPKDGSSDSRLFVQGGRWHHPPSSARAYDMKSTVDGTVQRMPHGEVFLLRK